MNKNLPKSVSDCYKKTTEGTDYYLENEQNVEKQENFKEILFDYFQLKYSLQDLVKEWTAADPRFSQVS